MKQGIKSDEDGHDEKISNRYLWDIAKALHQESLSGANGLHIYFELRRVRDAALDFEAKP